MTMVRFATVCDNPKCLKRSPEYVAWPSCRGCGNHVCNGCVEPFSMREHERDSDGVAILTLDCLCGDCLESSGLDEHCDEQAALKVGYDADYARAEAEYRDLDRGEL